MKKYRIKSREELLKIYSEAVINEWDKDVQDMLGTIQEGEECGDGDLRVGDYGFNEGEFEEVKEEIDFSVSSIKDDKPSSTDLITSIVAEYTDKHYDFYYDLTEEELSNKRIKVDPYFVAKQWNLGEKDPSGCLFHIMKNSSRFGVKNSAEREIKALKDIIKRLEDLNK